uniref:Uncharacterized protein n=1 Tax=Knipowitschia caucasica TaxID=637954 RepID=A0AAV2LZF8_KNICA
MTLPVRNGTPLHHLTQQLLMLNYLTSTHLLKIWTLKTTYLKNLPPPIHLHPWWEKRKCQREKTILSQYLWRKKYLSMTYLV